MKKTRTPRPVVTQRVQLHRALSKLGICSRKEAVPLIRSGRVTINGRAIREPLVWVDLGREKVALDGRAESLASRTYLALHKPPGFVTTKKDEKGRSTIMDLLPTGLASEHLFPVGRLDADSEGLIFLTNDGPWADAITSPEGHVAKTYEVTTDVEVAPADLEALAAGVMLDGKRTLPAEVTAAGRRRYRVTIREGRNRQVRRMFGSVGTEVTRLVRVAIGGYQLGDLAPGATAVLDRKDLPRFGLDRRAKRERA